MKSFHRPVPLGTLLFLALCLLSCSTEIDLYDDAYSDQLFVWACLDGSGDLHQVKVRKAISEEASLEELLARPDAYLPGFSPEVSLSTQYGYSVLLDPVLYPPQSGTFAQDSNLIYEARDYYPDSGDSVELSVADPVTGEVVSAVIKPLGRPAFRYPFPGSENARYNFTDPERPFYISWSGGDVWVWSISIKYLDILLTGDTIYRKGTFFGEPKYSSPAREFPLEYLWNIFRKVIPDDPMVDYRMFHRFDFGIWAGDYHLSLYLANANKFNDNRRAHFCNIRGGAGLFYSVNQCELKNIRTYDNFANRLHTEDTLGYMKFSRYIYNGFFIDPDSTLANPIKLLAR